VSARGCHRTVALMLVVGAFTPTFARTLSAQAIKTARDSSSHAISFGYFATLGANWQIEAVEIGYVFRRARGLAAISLAGRMGQFIDQTNYLSRSRGMVFAGTVSVRTRMLPIGELGDEEHVTPMGFDLTIEAAGYVANGSPFWQGSRWGAVSLLPSLRIGPGALTVGPTLFLAGLKQKPAMRGVLALRGEASLSRRSKAR
jgi:hypothetical protein